jgi:perosamine synthetase
LRNQGEDPNKKYHHQRVGFNARLTDIQAAIGLVQISKLDKIIERRIELATRYTEYLLTHADRVKVVVSANNDDQQSWFFYSILLSDRDKVANYLRTHQIDTRVPYPMPVYGQEAVQQALAKSSLPISACPNAEQLTSRVLALPMYHSLSSQEQQRVVDRLVESLS